jgi:hypothetical protein
MRDLGRQCVVVDGGQPRRRLDVSWAAGVFGLRTKTPVDDRLTRPMGWDLDERGVGLSG